LISLKVSQIVLTVRVSDQTLNRLSVLKAIRRHGPVSRTELPGLTGLSGGTITQLTGDLLARGLVLETRSTDKRPGRPRIDLSINAGAGIVIGVSIAGPGLVAVRFVDLLGESLFAYDGRMQPARTLEQFVETIADCIMAAISASPFDPSELTRIGVSCPGLVDAERGTLHFVTTFGGGPIPAAAMISERTGLPVSIENDLACIARALHWFGPAAALDTFTLLQVGHAVATAEYADGLPRSGANCLNSEFGHVKTAFGAAARPCFCGASGCMTAYTSIYGILQRANLLDDLNFPSLGKMSERFDDFLYRAEQDDPQARTLLREGAEHLGIGVANLLTASDPGHVLISVSSQRFIRQLEPRFWEVLRECAFPGVLAASDVRFIVASDSTWRRGGMAALALEQTYLGEDRQSRSQAPARQCQIHGARIATPPRAG
jgi:predicted NBD/HSP70 family sugar kinase